MTEGDFEFAGKIAGAVIAGLIAAWMAIALVSDNARSKMCWGEEDGGPPFSRYAVAAWGIFALLWCFKLLALAFDWSTVDSRSTVALFCSFGLIVVAGMYDFFRDRKNA